MNDNLFSDDSSSDEEEGQLNTSNGSQQQQIASSSQTMSMPYLNGATGTSSSGIASSSSVSLSSSPPKKGLMYRAEFTEAAMEEATEAARSQLNSTDNVAIANANNYNNNNSDNNTIHSEMNGSNYDPNMNMNMTLPPNPFPSTELLCQPAMSVVHPDNDNNNNHSYNDENNTNTNNNNNINIISNNNNNNNDINDDNINHYAPDVEDITEVEWADPSNPHNEPHLAPRPKQSKRDEPCGCTPDFIDEHETILDTSKLCCIDNSCVLYACMEECRSNCLAGPLCGNKRIQRKEWKKVQVIDAGMKGRGLRLLESAKAGDFIIEYTGVAVQKQYLDSLFNKYRQEQMLYIMALTSDVFIDARKKGSVARYINHSCQPNCRVIKWNVRGMYRAGIFAYKDIAAGEELSFDYQWKKKRGRSMTKCYCASENCRGTLEDSTLAPGEVDEDLEAQLKGHWKTPAKLNAGKEIINRTIKVYSTDFQEYLMADVCKFDEQNGMHCLIYKGIDDLLQLNNQNNDKNTRDVEEVWENLSLKKWLILDEEMEQYVISKKSRTFQSTPLLPQDITPLHTQPTLTKKYFIMVQTPMKEKIFARHLIDRCQRFHRVQISIIQCLAEQYQNNNNNNSTDEDQEAIAAEKKALEESNDGQAWKFSIEGLEPAQALEYLEKNIASMQQKQLDLQQQQSQGDWGKVSNGVFKKEIIIPRCVLDQIKSRLPLLRNNCKNADILIVHSQSKTKQFGKILIESTDKYASEQAEIILWKDALTLCNACEAPRAPSGLFKDLAFLGGELSNEDFNLLFPSSSNGNGNGNGNTTTECTENVREAAALAAFEDMHRCTLWIQTSEDMGRIDSSNRLVDESIPDGRRKIFFGCEPPRIPELWGHFLSRVKDASRGVRYYNMEPYKQFLPMMQRNLDPKPRNMASSFFDYVSRITGASVRLDMFSRNHLRIDGGETTATVEFQRRVDMAEEILQLQVELLKDSSIRQNSWCFGREWSQMIDDLPKVIHKQQQDATITRSPSPKPTGTSTSRASSNNRSLTIACMEISEIADGLGLDGHVAAHACVILFRYLIVTSYQILSSSQMIVRGMELACLFLANKAQKTFRWKRMEGLLEGAYKVFYPGSVFDAKGEEASLWEKRVLSAEADILNSLEYDIFWGGTEWIENVAVDDAKFGGPSVNNTLEFMLSGPLLAVGPNLWVKLGPQYAFTATAALLSMPIDLLFSSFSLSPLKLMNAVEMVTESISFQRSVKFKSSKNTHDIFNIPQSTLSSLKNNVDKFCKTRMSLGLGRNMDRPLGRIRIHEEIANRSLGRKRFQGIDKTLLEDFLLPRIEKLVQECDCNIYIEEGFVSGKEDMIIEGSWRALALIEHFIQQAMTENNPSNLEPSWSLNDANIAAPSHQDSRDISRKLGKMTSGLMKMSDVDAIEDVSSDVAESKNKAGGKTCIPGQISSSIFRRSGLRWYLRQPLLSTINGSLCNLLHIRTTFISNGDTHLAALADIANTIGPVDHDGKKQSFSILRSLSKKVIDVDFDSNVDDTSNVLVSLQRWPPKKTEMRERSKGGMGIGISPAALQEMHLLCQLHSQIPAPKGHPNFILPLSIAVDDKDYDSNEDTPVIEESEKETRKRSFSDILTGSTNELLLYHYPSTSPTKETLNPSKGKVKNTMKGSHLIFQPMPMILQRVINNSKRRRSEKVDANLVSPSILTAWVHDLLTAFAHCHENHIVLRTLYPDQILFDSSGLAKLSGLTRAMVLHPSDRNRYIDPVALLSKSKGKKASSSGVTEDDILNNPYMAPELLLGATKYTSQSDMWTLGCLISHMILNKPLFSGRDRESKVHAIFKIVGTPSSTNYKQAEDFPYYSSCRLSKKYKSGVEKALRYMLKDQDSTVVDSYGGILNLLESMLVLDPKKRISAFDALHHESMKSFVNETTNENYRARFVEDWIKMKESILSSGESDDVSGADHDNITGGRNTINTGSASQELFSNGLGVSKLAGSMENVDDLYNLDDILGSNSFGGKRMKLSG